MVYKETDMNAIPKTLRRDIADRIYKPKITDGAPERTECTPERTGAYGQAYRCTMCNKDVWAQEIEAEQQGTRLTWGHLQTEGHRKNFAVIASLDTVLGPATAGGGLRNVGSAREKAGSIYFDKESIREYWGREVEFMPYKMRKKLRAGGTIQYTAHVTRKQKVKIVLRDRDIAAITLSICRYDGTGKYEKKEIAMIPWDVLPDEPKDIEGIEDSILAMFGMTRGTETYGWWPVAELVLTEEAVEWIQTTWNVWVGPDQCIQIIVCIYQMLGWTSEEYGDDNTPMEAWTTPARPLQMTMKGGGGAAPTIVADGSEEPEHEPGDQKEHRTMGLHEMIAKAAKADGKAERAARYLSNVIATGRAKIKVMNATKLGPTEEMETAWEAMDQWQEAQPYAETAAPKEPGIEDIMYLTTYFTNLRL